MIVNQSMSMSVIEPALKNPRSEDGYYFTKRKDRMRLAETRQSILCITVP